MSSQAPVNPALGRFGFALAIAGVASALVFALRAQPGVLPMEILLAGLLYLVGALSVIVAYGRQKNARELIWLRGLRLVFAVIVIFALVRSFQSAPPSG